MVRSASSHQVAVLCPWWPGRSSVADTAADAAPGPYSFSSGTERLGSFSKRAAELVMLVDWLRFWVPSGETFLTKLLGSSGWTSPNNSPGKRLKSPTSASRKSQVFGCYISQKKNVCCTFSVGDVYIPKTCWFSCWKSKSCRALGLDCGSALVHICIWWLYSKWKSSYIYIHQITTIYVPVVI